MPSAQVELLVNLECVQVGWEIHIKNIVFSLFSLHFEPPFEVEQISFFKFAEGSSFKCHIWLNLFFLRSAAFILRISRPHLI